MSRTRRPVPGTRAALRAALYLTAAALAAAGCSRDAGPAELGEIATVASPAGPGSGQPNLAVGPDGRVHLSWLEPVDDSQRALRASLLEEGGASPPRTVVQRANFFVNWADFPSLAALPGGRLAAHWLERTGSGTYAYGVRISLSDDDGASWSAPITPHRDDSDTEHGFVSLYAEGEVLNAVWLDGRNFDGHEAGHGHGHDAGPGPEMMLLHTTVAPDGTLGAEQRLDARVCDCCQTGVALAADGPVVVYRDRSAEEIRDIYAVRREGGAWSAPRPVHADGWRIEGCPVNGPAIAAEGREVAVAWFTGAQDTARVRLAFSGRRRRQLRRAGPRRRRRPASGAWTCCCSATAPRWSAGWSARAPAEVRVRTVSATAVSARRGPSPSPTPPGRAVSRAWYAPATGSGSPGRCRARGRRTSPPRRWCDAEPGPFRLACRAALVAALLAPPPRRQPRRRSRTPARRPPSPPRGGVLSRRGPAPAVSCVIVGGARGRGVVPPRRGGAALWSARSCSTTRCARASPRPTPTTRHPRPRRELLRQRTLRRARRRRRLRRLAAGRARDGARTRRPRACRARLGGRGERRGQGPVGRARPRLEARQRRVPAVLARQRLAVLPLGPRGHAFALAAAALGRGRRPWATALGYGAAGVVGWSRIHEDRHWASDVVGGAIGGAVVSRLDRALAAAAPRAGRRLPRARRLLVAPGRLGVILAGA
jgi:hypothetical protein